MAKPPIIFSPRWWRILAMIIRERRRMRERRAPTDIAEYERLRRLHETDRP